jgi:uncharacterized surface protein with fasciclin (FAS1) repeats
VCADACSARKSRRLDHHNVFFKFEKRREGETNTTINDAQVLTSPRATANGAYISIDKVISHPQREAPTTVA